MSEGTNPPPGEAGQGEAAATGEFEQLRRLLLPTELDRLDAVERRLDDPEARAEDVSRVLPESLARAARRDARLGLALSGTLDEALEVSVRRHRRRFADVLAPAMGPAIRRAIAEALRATVDSFNQLLQHSLSVRSFRWRLEAWRTGRSFAEVLLSHSLVFQVEQVFLVYRESGLLLQHAAAQPGLAADADLVSGMLTAIQDFVRDSFSVEAEQAVDTMRVGDLAVWVEQGEKAYLAAVIRGTPPAHLRATLRDTLDAIHLEFGDALANYSGDTTSFEGARQHLEGCLQAQVRLPARRRRWLAPAAAGAVVLVSLVALLVLEVRAGRRWESYLARLSAEPGIVVVKESHGLRRASIEGLRDPDAADPVPLLRASGLDPARVRSRWDSFVSQAPAVVLARARAILRPPPTTALSSSGGILRASGTAPHGWLVEASRRAAAIPGVQAFDAAAVTDEGLSAIAAVRDHLHALVLRFDRGSAELPARERPAFESAVATFRELGSAAARGGVAVRVEVIGHTDGTGSEGTNVRLSRARAEWVVSALEAKGVRNIAFALVGVGSNEPLRAERADDDRALNRCVTFHLRVEDQS